MLTLSELQDNENNFHIPQPEATRPHLGATRPRVGIAKLGFDPPTWQ